MIKFPLRKGAADSFKCLVGLYPVSGGALNSRIFYVWKLGVCRFVDRVIVLKEGKLVEEGSHEELVSRNGVYASMYKSQSKWYSSRSVPQLS